MTDSVSTAGQRTTVISYRYLILITFCSHNDQQWFCFFLLTLVNLTTLENLHVSIREVPKSQSTELEKN